ncbi:MAG: aminoglycoside phosphotransferase family protein [Clostridia bacterium]|nr:aminoglycoside phosphotransferase family protein [Clostridia bacterium]
MFTVDKEILEAFEFDGEIVSCGPVGNGLINSTFRADTGSRAYIIQKINNKVFRDVDALMENICGVTSYLRDKIISAGGDPNRETLNVINTKNGFPYFRCKNGYYWRCYEFISDTVVYNAVECPDDFYSCALAFSEFQRQLDGFPADKLYETIPDFHNTPDRCAKLMRAVRNDFCNRLEGVRDEIAFVTARAGELSYFVDRLCNRSLPLRITHNDTKLNNILFDKETNKALCVVDLDTVMPGAVAYDFGDAIRSGAPTLNEDTLTPYETRIDLELFEAFTKGFLEGCGDCLTENEIDSLVWGSKLMTLECGIRFLTDYLEGDVYFKTTRNGHNLSRARSQFALVADMENNWYEMTAIVEKYKKIYFKG